MPKYMILIIKFVISEKNFTYKDVKNSISKVQILFKIRQTSEIKRKNK